MHLNRRELLKTDEWAAAGIVLPRFAINAMIEATREAPEWVHFGAGNIFRAFPALVQQRLLNAGLAKTGIIAVSGRDGSVIDTVYRAYDNLSLAVTLKSDGRIEKEVIGSVAESHRMDTDEGFDRLKEIVKSPSLKMASFTVTEKGYALHDNTYMEHVAALFLSRYYAGSLPLAFVSMDNCSQNGEKLYAALESAASKMVSQGLADDGFLAYLADRRVVSFPWTMIDKITPSPDKGVKAMLEDSGFEDTAIFVSGMGTHLAPFVNAEETGYLVMEDSFPSGRPAGFDSETFRSSGVFLTDRETVDATEKMKVGACLNPVHTALAVFGCLLGFKHMNETLADADLAALARRVGYDEGLKALKKAGGKKPVIDPEEFLDELLTKRISNPFLPDTPQRIATDSSQKIPVRYAGTIKALAGELTAIPLVIAAWLRYLLGVDDDGKPFTPSPDPRLEELQRRLEGITLGTPGDFHETLEPLLCDKSLFGVDLYEAGLGEKIEDDFARLAAGPGAVRRVLHEEISG